MDAELALRFRCWGPNGTTTTQQQQQQQQQQKSLYKGEKSGNRKPNRTLYPDDGISEDSHCVTVSSEVEAFYLARKFLK
ncbi:hypothetical protein H671_3g8614 [Cricetulus griseus]|uniref:Uncharacterized protein n=1 Tax=Cricetulus griseus TaxID=10029 RepID=A0A061IF60_CRIGR|nr:hypothetical protein H671_3g8614 [Cricetulus griseus]